MYQRRVVGLVLVCAAAALTIAAVATRTWWVLRDGERGTRVGLRDAEICEDAKRRDDDFLPAPSRCTDRTLRAFLVGQAAAARDEPWPDEPPAWSETRRRPPVSRTFVWLGTLVLGAGLGAIVVSIGVAATALSAREPRARALPSFSSIAWGGFAALALAFVVAAPSDLRHLRAGIGPLLALAGAACGVAAAFVLGRVDPAREPGRATLRAADQAATIRRVPGLLAGAIGVGLILTSLLTHAWFQGRDERRSLGVGVQEAKVCGGRWPEADAGCSIATIPGDVADAREPTRMRAFLAAGTLVGWSGFGAAIAFAIAALLALLRQAVPPPVTLGRVTIAAGALFVGCGLAYVLSRPDEASEISVSYGALVGLGGGGALIGAGILFGRWAAAVTTAAAALPAETAPTVDTPIGPPVPATIPACPRCGTPMLWVTAKQAWLCTVCKDRD